MRVAVAIDKGKAENADVEAIHSEEGAFGVQRAGVKEIAPHDFHVVRTQLGRAAGIAHERADLITPEGKAFTRRLPTFPVAPVMRILMAIP